MDSFRDQLVFSIGFALSRHELAERVVKHLEGSGFDLDEPGRTLWQRPSGQGVDAGDR